ncbi:STE/STE11 protein kinase, variant 1 [Phytophthora nicotianae CJ01A1]|uniref:STE/STE11 protein kinase, variant 1 n=1 Tax=Phytophthora nicotianae CJ01A1 TaxID=1317063 RepID=W2VXY6_PHYNI|nr:STE/STE11 protein kinase, variant 1 [Phytophthora nicotianae CJ01A1]
MSAGFVSSDAMLNVVAELSLFRIQDWSADEVSTFCSFFFRGEDVERNFDYRLFLDYLFFPVSQHAPRIKLKKQVAVEDIFTIHEGSLTPPQIGPEESDEHPCIPVVIKQLDLEKFAGETEKFPQFGGTEELVGQMRHRVNELRLLTHPNLAGYQTTLQNGNSLYVIQEHHQICTLKTILESFGPMKEPTIRRYLLQILQALTFLHDHGVQHGNLTMQTVQIDSYGLLKLADFGIRRCLLPLLSRAHLAKDDCAYNTVAPEALRDFRLWGEKTDVWCVGILTLQMANGLVNYPPQQLFDQPKCRNPSRSARFQPSRSPVTRQEMELPGDSLPDLASRNLKNFVRACTQRDPRKRPSAKELLEMGFFQIDQTKETNEVLRTVCTDLDATMRKLRSSSPTPLRRKSRG